MALTLEDVQKVALLARLELEPDELERQATHINRLLEHFEELQGIDVTGVDPTLHSNPMQNVFREDVVHASLVREDLLANAPAVQDGCVLVPRIIEA